MSPDLLTFIGSAPSPAAAAVLGVTTAMVRMVRAGRRPATPAMHRRWLTHALKQDPPVGRRALRLVRHGVVRFGGEQYALPAAYAADGVQAVVVARTRSGALLVLPTSAGLLLTPVDGPAA